MKFKQLLMIGLTLFAVILIQGSPKVVCHDNAKAMRVAQSVVQVVPCQQANARSCASSSSVMSWHHQQRDSLVLIISDVLTVLAFLLVLRAYASPVFPIFKPPILG